MKSFIPLLILGLFFAQPPSFSTTKELTPPFAPSFISSDSLDDPTLSEAALTVLQNKCNVCHRKKNPFKVFSSKNMDKHAKRIYKQVFVYERMPKGNTVKLTDEESQVLKNWLKSKNIF